MRKRFGQALRIGVSPRGLALVKTSRWGGAPLEVLAEHHFADGAPGFEALGAGVRKLLEGAGGARWPLTVVLDDELARLWLVTPPEGSTRLADLEAAAALRFQTLFGESATDWKVAGGWDATGPFLAAAMPRHLLALLEQAAGEQGAVLVEVVPQFIAGWNRWRGALGPGAWFAQVHGNVLALGALAGGSVQAVRSIALPDGASLAWLGQHVAREALRLNMQAPDSIAVAGDAPPAWNKGSAGGFACSLLAPRSGTLSAPARMAATGAQA